jgi:hypothetical protein
LGLADELEELEDQLIAIERQRKVTEKEASKLEDQKISLRNTMDNCDDEIEKWEALEEKLNDGKTVYAPVAKTRKRKRSSSSTDSEDEDKDNDSDESDNESQSSDRGSPLTTEDIETKVQELKELKTKIKDFKAEARSIEDNRSRICIAARNQYSKSAIQVDFAAGIKEVSRSLHIIYLVDLTNLSYSWTKKQPRRRILTSTLKKTFATTRRSLKTCLSTVYPVELIRSCLVGW